VHHAAPLAVDIRSHEHMPSSTGVTPNGRSSPDRP
jgi:hypothetical protein